MPILAVITQPNSNSIWAAYRPISFYISATKTDNTPIPPVVYCDIYINGIYYRSIARTYFVSLLSDRTEWFFDIQDSLQEYLGKFIGLNGENNIVEAIPLVSQVQVKFRSSGINGEGFIIPENTAPIQSTSNSPAIPGTGTASNMFWVVNIVLQHTDNQNVVTHLNSFKTGVWDTNTYPLTHRPKKYLICRNDSDYFPILTDKQPDHIALVYRNKGQINWQTVTLPLNCISLTFEDLVLPTAFREIPYHAELEVLGTLPIVIDTIVKPAWMTIEIVDNTVTFSGIPDTLIVDAAVSFKAYNCGDVSGQSWINAITVEEPSCIPITFTLTPVFNDAEVDHPYLENFTINGTLPINISSIVKPAWMTIAILDNTLTLSGTPTSTASNSPISFTLTNCTDTVRNISGNIDVLPDSSGINFNRIYVKYGVDPAAVCAMSSTGVGYIAGGILTSGLVIYTDEAMTIAITGYMFVQQLYGGDIFNLNGSNGMVLSSTGLTC